MEGSNGLSKRKGRPRKHAIKSIWTEEQLKRVRAEIAREAIKAFYKEDFLGKRRKHDT